MELLALHVQNLLEYTLHPGKPDTYFFHYVLAVKETWLERETEFKQGWNLGGEKKHCPL